MSTIVNILARRKVHYILKDKWASKQRITPFSPLINIGNKVTMATSANDFDLKQGILDIETPRGQHLRGVYKKSFAYHTFRHRIPNILDSLLDSMKKDLSGSTYSQDDITQVLTSIEKLKDSIANTGPLENFQPNEHDNDIELWNKFLSTLPADASFYNICWLYAECYLYRRVYSYFRSSNSLREYDYFSPQKMHALHISIGAMVELIRNTKTLGNNFESFSHMLKLNLWGNKCDLSLSTGQDVKPLDNLNKLVDSLNGNILTDDCVHIWNCIQSGMAQQQKTQKRCVDFVCDNAGFELFTDLLLGKYLIEHNLTDMVRFHVKTMPWFVSDTTPPDVQNALKYMENHATADLSDFGKQCLGYFNNGIFEIEARESFWTTPYEFYRMNDIAPGLYQLLSTSLLIIFKGDLNYRKLLGDFNWDPTENFQKCLRGFNPSNLCTLRTVKADLICGLKPGLAEELTSKTNDWMLTGEYAVIQFAKGAKEN